MDLLAPKQRRRNSGNGFVRFVGEELVSVRSLRKLTMASRLRGVEYVKSVWREEST